MLEPKNKSLKKSVNINNENERKYERKEYQISTSNMNYFLGVEIDNKYIHFTVQELNIISNYIFKNKYELSNIISKLNLVQNKYTSLSRILRFVDKAYSKNKISLEQKSDNELYLIFEVPVDFEEEKFSLTLKKKYLDDKEVLSILIEQINKLNNNNALVKNKFNEIEKQINIISRKNSAGRISESSDINEEINIIKQQINDINGRLSGTKVISDNLKPKNNKDKVYVLKSSLNKNNDDIYKNNYNNIYNNDDNFNNNIYKSQNRKRNELYDEKEDDKDEKSNYNINKRMNYNERYGDENDEDGFDKDSKPEIYLKNNNKILNKNDRAYKERRNGSQDEYRDRDRDRKIDKDRDNINNTNIKKSLKKSQKDLKDLKKSNRYRINDDDPRDDQKYLNDKKQKMQNKKIKLVNDQENNSNYNNRENDRDYNFENPYKNDTIINNNYEKRYNNNSPKLKDKTNYSKRNPQNKLTQSKTSTLKKERKENIPNLKNNINLNKNNQTNNINNINNIKEVSKIENGSIIKKKKPSIKRSSQEIEEYLKKTDYKYKSTPIELKYKMDICKTNTSCGWNDMFEIYISYKNNKEYLASPDNNNYNINIISLINNKLENKLQGHNNKVRTIRYFIEDNNKKSVENEYLISADDDHIVIIWDLLDNYEIKQKIDTNYEDDIYSCLIFFNKNIENADELNYIVTSTYSTSNDIQSSATKIYSLESGQYLFFIKESNFDNIYYLLLWHNNQNNKNYLIQFSYKKILINYLNQKSSNELYAKLVQEPENEHYSGFIFNKNNSDFLCSSSYNGFIHIWDLYKKTIVKTIDTKCILCHIIPWNEKYAIAADFENKSFIVIDMVEKKIYNDYNIEHTLEVKCVKKLFHPSFGECLLTAGRDNIIKLWKL